MPPARRYAGPRRPGEHSAKVTKRKTFRYRKGNSRASSSGRKSTGNTIQLTTLSRKSEDVSIDFRELFDFSSMGGDNGSTPTILRVDLNNPVAGGPTPSGSDKIAVVLHNLKSGSSDPVFNSYSYDNDQNLSSRLQEYFNLYRSAVVTSAEATVVVTPKINQTYYAVSGDRSVVPYLVNVTDANTGNTYLKTMPPNAMSEVNVWMVRQQNTGQLINSTDGSLPLETLKQGIPGMKMQRLNITANSKKGVTYKMKYTPKSQYGFKDWKDNKHLLECFNDQPGNADQKHAFMYVGIAGRDNNQDPTATTGAGLVKGLPNFKVEVKVKYNIHFSERINKDGNNEPVPHQGDL